jgi:hypothetical protein
MVTSFTANALQYNLAIGGSGWALRTAGMTLLSSERRGSDFDPHVTESDALTRRMAYASYQRPITTERFLARAPTTLVNTYGRLFDAANRATALEDLQELAAQARLELSDQTSAGLAPVLATVAEELADRPLLAGLFAACFQAGSDGTDEAAALEALGRNVVPDDQTMRGLDPLRIDAVAAAVRYMQGARVLRDTLRSAACCAYGRHAERRAIEEWNAISVVDDHILAPDTGPEEVLETEWFPGAVLRGRPDGYMGATGEVVEFKFRATGFARGGTLRDAERLQVHAYMFMTGTQRCTVLEGVCRRGSVVLRHTTVAFDETYWEAVTHRARRLVEFRHQIASHDLFRSAYFALSLENQVRMIESAVLDSGEACRLGALTRSTKTELDIETAAARAVDGESAGPPSPCGTASGKRQRTE